ncbi:MULTISPECIES: hypothetical protein [Streptacidiphilus]|uniref:Uncharacterized protein n=1 Tax=Streptacidiphilus cavernicola TaxID=3342716 RepID=A0ABV6V0A6_9ACTN|nr:hypothetical protein [Streptacidiphilus jeojiense]
METRTQTWFHPVTRTGGQIAEATERQLRRWGTELTTEQMMQLAVATTAMRRAAMSCSQSVQLEVNVTLQPGHSVTVEMVERSGAELAEELLLALDSIGCRWGVVPKTRGPGCTLWAAVELHGASRFADTAVRLARTSHGRVLRKALPAPLERTARRWLAA